MAVVRSSPGPVWRFLPAATVVLSAVYVAGAAVALVVGGPAQRLVGVVVVAVTAARLAALWATTGRRGAAPWS